MRRAMPPGSSSRSSPAPDEGNFLPMSISGSWLESQPAPLANAVSSNRTPSASPIARTGHAPLPSPLQRPPHGLWLLSHPANRLTVLVDKLLDPVRFRCDRSHRGGPLVHLRPPALIFLPDAAIAPIAVTICSREWFAARNFRPVSVTSSATTLELSLPRRRRHAIERRRLFRACFPRWRKHLLNFQGLVDCNSTLGTGRVYAGYYCGTWNFLGRGGRRLLGDTATRDGSLAYSGTTS